MVSPIINNVTMTKGLVDNEASLNLLFAKLVEKLQLPLEQMKPTDPFRGINPRVVQPMGRITLPVTFGSREAFRTEHIVFDVAHTPLPYNGIVGARNSGTGDVGHPLFGSVEGEGIALAIAGVTKDTKCRRVSLPRFGPPGGVTPYVLLGDVFTNIDVYRLPGSTRACYLSL